MADREHDDADDDPTAPPRRRLEALRAARGAAGGRTGILLPPVFGGPTYRLTARQPYQASPEAYLVAWNAQVFLPFDDTISWEVDHDHRGSPLLGLDAVFADTPDGPATVTIEIVARSWPGVTGHVTAIGFRDAVTVRAAISQTLAPHTIELTVPPPGPRELEVAMVIEHGVRDLTFRSLTLGPARPVIGPVLG
ncbi:hypothetical protein [Miltoncostaea marina]|uniref:hypothetical protein n=1 Tax=Miltoncostaea marina TaxID=2843215 RepID=UPI001C3DFEA0|nr:hypothetical protein [Miltoncostaea marina]